MTRKNRLFIVFISSISIAFLGFFHPNVFSFAQFVLCAIAGGMSLGLIMDEFEFTKTNQAFLLAISSLRFYASPEAYRETSEDEFLELKNDHGFIQGQEVKLYAGSTARETLEKIDHILQ